MLMKNKTGSSTILYDITSCIHEINEIPSLNYDVLQIIYEYYVKKINKIQLTRITVDW